MKQIETVSIIGMGALGILFGEFLTQKLSPESVTFIADKNRIEKYRREGVFCNGRRCEFSLSDGTRPARPTDLLLFAVKSTALDDVLEEARPLVGPDTIILSLLNGIVSEDRIGGALGHKHVLTCIAQGMDAVKLGNRLTYSHMGELRLGILPGEEEKLLRLEAVKELFDRIGFPYAVDEDIRRRLWGKWMLNVGVNQVVMVEQGTYGTVQQPGKARETMLNAMREVLALAKKEGVPLTDEDLNGYVALLDTLSPDGMPSMRQDGIEKRRSEVDLFSGTVLEKAKKLGISTPVNEYLYKTVQEMESAY